MAVIHGRQKPVVKGGHELGEITGMEGQVEPVLSKNERHGACLQCWGIAPRCKKVVNRQGEKLKKRPQAVTDPFEDLQQQCKSSCV